MTPMPWDTDVIRRLAVDVDRLDRKELRREVRELRGLVVDLREVVRDLIEDPAKLTY
jgi:hypothetical protein